MNVNIWIGIPEDDHNELNNIRGTQNASDAVLDFVNGQLDPAVVQNLFLTHTLGANVLHLWSIILDDANGAIDSQVNDFRTAYPGCQVLGCWHVAGNMLGTDLVLTEVPNPDYVGEPYTIPNPDYQPDPGLPDYDYRVEIVNPAWVPETIIERSQTGTPNYESPAYLIEFMPDVDDVGTRPTEVSDINLPLGWAPRIFQ